ncbi:MAG: acetyl-CoA C-acyltransferase [Myxococcales bacterium]|nr:acetyl-CoA C-acyltransferase [Myxococcota bacterium]MDW8281745.1 acetyl-CoA C-acyltransferase [Myxococcales bacterium]
MSTRIPEPSPGRDVWIVGAVRGPIGRHRGALKDLRPDDMLAQVLRALCDRTRVPPETIDDVIVGCANQAGEDNRNVARMGLLLAGLPDSVPGVTVNRLCASGLEALLQAVRAIRAGEGELYIAGGVESMTRAPLVMPKPDVAFATGNITVYDSSLGWRFPNPRMRALFPLESMGETAENLAQRYQIGRREQDEFALRSHERAVAAQRGGRFDGELVPLEVPLPRGGTQRVDRDEGPRPDTSLERLGALPPVFREGGSVTAGNSSPLSDGAAALLLASPARAQALGLPPLARVVGGAVAGVDPRYMGIGPVPAVRRLLARSGLTLADVDLFELNEAFAVQVLAVRRELGGPDLDVLNVEGGAIALGHPLGCSGARIVVTMVHTLARRRARRGLCAMCVGVGQGVAALLERVE